MELLERVIAIVSVGFEVAGVSVIVLGFGYAVVRATSFRGTEGAGRHAYHAVRRIFGKSILLGLEILVAADLIRTIAIEPTLDALAVLAVLIGIRTFLSWSLDVELEGVWPWDKRRVIDNEHLSGINYSEDDE